RCIAWPSTSGLPAPKPTCISLSPAIARQARPSARLNGSAGASLRFGADGGGIRPQVLHKKSRSALAPGHYCDLARHHLVERPLAALGKHRIVQSGLANSLISSRRVALLQKPIELRLEARAFIECQVDLAALFPDGGHPAQRAPFRLIIPFEKVLSQ